MFSFLIIEPDSKLASQVQQLLVGKDYFVKVCHGLTPAYLLLEQRSFDVVITAHQLPDGDSLELLSYLRHFAFQTKCMLLAKNTTYHDRIAAYRKGVDDFLVKPFSLTELWWRLQVLCHRQKVLQRQAVALCDEVAVYPKEGLLKIKDQAITMPKRESQILTCLINHRSRVVGRDELMRWVWSEGDNVPKSITLDVYIKRIRMKLGQYSEQLETVRGFGYRIK
jgi:two-component system, OmpR family, response regulator